MRIAVLVIVITSSTLLGLASVWPLAVLVDTVLVRESGSSPLLQVLPEALRANRGAQILALACAVFLLRVLQELLSGWRSLLNISIGHAGILRLRSDLFTRLQELNLLYHRSQPQGDTIFRLTRDTSGCEQVLNVLIEVMIAALMLVVMLTVMLVRSTPLTMIALAVIPLLLTTNILFGRVLKRQSRLAQSAESDFLTMAQRGVATINLTQAFGRQQYEHRRFSSHSQRNLDARFDLQRQLVWYRICVGLIFGAGTAAIFGWGGWMAWNDQLLGENPDGMTVGSLVLFIAYLGMLYDPLCKLSGAGANMVQGTTGMERVFEVLDQEAVVTDSPVAQSLPLRARPVVLNNVSFSYNPEKPVLRNVSLEIPAGDMVAFVGSSGVGKSTLLNLLGRFFDPASGQIEIDGIDFRDVTLDDLRRHISFVFQENLVLPTTISENIAYGRPDATLEEIREAARLAGAAEFIEGLSYGYDTELAEGGGNLSGGQRQRIAIARALLTEAPIIVLDEPTSALDPECERLVMETLRRLKGKRTIIIVSHRVHTVADCDEIFVMHEGRVVGRGNHRELLAKGGWYYEMTAGASAGMSSFKYRAA